MDEIDVANQQMELAIENSLRRNKQHRRVINATGYCLYCKEPLQHGQRFCDEDCRDDFETEEAAKTRKHGVR